MNIPQHLSRNVGLWKGEYEKQGIPSSFREEPSGSVVWFMHFLEKEGKRVGRAVDLGAGTGRNSIYLADQGFEVASLEFVPGMADEIRARSDASGVSDRVKVSCQSVTSPWPLENASVDFAVDTFCYKHQITRDDRAAYRSELLRVLKSGGLFLLTLADIDDGYYGPLLSESPDPAERVIVDPANGIRSVLYSRAQVEEEFASGMLLLVHHEAKEKGGVMHGKQYNRITHIFVFRRQ